MKMVQNRFKNGHHLPLQFLNGKFAKQMANKRNNDRTKVQEYLETLIESALKIKEGERP